MAEAPDNWRSFHQNLPIDLHERWKEQLRRIARVNGISPESWDGDSKFIEAVGPRVMTMEHLLVLVERSDDETLRV